MSKLNSPARWSLRWKILVPFAVLALVYATTGTFVFSRATAADARANQTARLRDAAAIVTDDIADRAFALSRLVRRVTFTVGVPDAIESKDHHALTSLVLPVVVNAGRSLVVVTNARGVALLDVRIKDGARPVQRAGTRLGADPLLRRALASGRRVAADFSSGFLFHTGIAYLAVAVPIVRDGKTIGAVVAADSVGALGRSLGELTRTSLTLLDGAGRVLVGSPLDAAPPSEDVRVQWSGRVGGRASDVLFVPLSIRGTRAATAAVALPQVSGLGSLGREGWWIGLVALGALVGVFMVGTIIARRITRPVDHLVASTRALAAGDLSHRVPAVAGGELAELATNFNQMAVELEASQRDLERRVGERTQELSEAMQRLDATNADLVRADQAKTAFLANVSHELRTPLSGILITSEMLHDPSFGKLSDAKVRDLSGKVHASGRHLLSLIDDLLDLSRIEAGRLEMRPEPVSLDALFGEIRGAIEPLARNAGVTVKLPMANGHRLMADPVRVRQVLYNLLTNAVRFTGRRGRVWIEVGAEGDEIAIAVHDTGIGIEAEDLQRIFEPFEQVSGRPTQGAGLGLAITKRIVEAHQGSLSVSSTPGKGSVFTVKLSKAEGTGPDVEVEPVAAVGAGRGRPRARILVIEDDRVTLDLVSRVLRAGGHRVDRATSVDEGLERARTAQSALVLLDLRLGAGDGLDVVRAIRRDPALRLLPVIALSAHGMSADIDRALEAGCDDYIVKPVGGKALLARVAEHLARADMLEASQVRRLNAPTLREQHVAGAPGR